MSRHILVALPLLAACAGDAVWAPDTEVAAARYVPTGAVELTLFTAVRNSGREGIHTALLLDAPDQRYLFDPAGSWWHPNAPERNDVIFGMQPVLLDHYLDYYADGDFHVVMQTVPVTADQAAQIADLMQEIGPVAPANCSRSITQVLNQVPGFETLEPTWFPLATMRAFAELPNVAETRYDDADNSDNIAIADARARNAHEVAMERAN